MDSSSRTQRHLDATEGREVVFCHACANEWWRDDHGILCPRCGGDITEIISPDSDPRFESESSSPGSAPYSEDEFDDPTHRGIHHRLHPHLHDHPDPDEVDIETELNPPPRAPDRSTRDRPDNAPHDEMGVFPILERFAGMIHGFAPPPQHPGRAEFFQLGGDENRRTRDSPHIHSTVLRSGNTSVTIVSGPAHELMAGGLAGGHRRYDPFSTMFDGVFRDVGSANDGARNPAEPGSPGDPGPNVPPFARGLAEILGLLTPANAVAGDAVYSQEALDRIISNLMEAHPQSNAAPPATEEALADLDRRFVDSSMLEGDSNTECAICIDTMKVGDMAAFLPCKHWFHEECVVLWLKEHNTCPVCRASIERREASGDRDRDRGRNGRMDSSSPYNPPFFRRTTSSTIGGGGGGIPTPNVRAGQTPRPPSQSQSRLNEVLRNMTSRASELEREPSREAHREPARDWDPRDRDRDRDRDWTQPWSYGSYDTARLQRRTSFSPTSPRHATPGDYRRMRQRSPSQSSGRREARGSEQNGRSAGTGPLNWFRDTFTNRGNSSRDPNRE